MWLINQNRLIISVCVLIGIVFLFFLPSRATVLSPYLDIRSEPNASSSVVISAEIGDTVYVSHLGGEWVRVRYRGKSGWANGLYIRGVDGYPLYDPEEESGLIRSTRICKLGQFCWISNHTWFTPMPNLVVGNALYYGSGVMEGSALKNGFDLSKYVGGIAVASPADVGTEFYLRGPNGWEGPFLAVDVMQRNHVWRIITYFGEVVEVDYQTAVRWRIVGNGSYHGVLVSKNVVNFGNPIDYVNWFVSISQSPRVRFQNWNWSEAWIR
jgi:hypothetical protein